jgi:hypothetical protein
MTYYNQYVASIIQYSLLQRIHSIIIFLNVYYTKKKTNKLVNIMSCYYMKIDNQKRSHDFNR